MIFAALSEAAENGELLIVDGGMLRYHLRRDGQVVVREVVVLPVRRRRRIGAMLVRMLRTVRGGRSILAKCPADLPANRFWEALGFILDGEATTRGGRRLCVWRFDLDSTTALMGAPNSRPSPSASAGDTAPGSPAPSTSGSSSPTRTGADLIVWRT